MLGNKYQSKAIMINGELRRLISEADSYHSKGDYARELQLRLQICALEPENPYCKHNLGLALKNNGELELALNTFTQLAVEHPYLSRVHNNLATTLLRMGADLGDIAPVFMNALRTSNNVPDFTTHFLNICGTIAYGMDEGAEDAFRLIENRFPEILRNIPPPNQVEKNIRNMESILAAYREIGVYRQALAQRKWGSAEIAINRAKGKLEEIGLHNFVVSIDKRVVPCFVLSREVMEILEGIAGGTSLTPKAALDGYQALLQKATTLVENHGPDSFQIGWLNVIRLFLTGAVQALRFLDDPFTKYESNKSLRHELADRTPSAYMDITRDLVSFLGFLDRQCLDLAQQIDSIANEHLIFTVRDEAWVRVALFTKGLALHFRGVDVSLARSLLDEKYDPLLDAKYMLRRFKSYVERQAYKDIFVGGRAQENIARALLQTYFTSRSYREVPVRGGFSDILLFSKDGRFLYETKIWRGIKYYQQGLREIAEYIIGEDDDKGLLGIFYVLFDGTSSQQAQSQLNGALSTVSVQSRDVEVIVINLVPPKPSSKKELGEA